MEIEVPGEVNAIAEAAQERADRERLKCDWCGCFPNRTHRGGRYLSERFYCKPHAALVEGARRVAGALWGSGATHDMNLTEAGSG